MKEAGKWSVTNSAKWQAAALIPEKVREKMREMARKKAG